MRPEPLDNTKVHSLIYKTHYQVYKKVLAESDMLSEKGETLGAKHRSALHLRSETKRPTLKKIINSFDSNDSGLAWELAITKIGQSAGGEVIHYGGTNPYDIDINKSKVECKIRRTRHQNKTSINNLHPDKFDLMVALIAEEEDKSLDWKVLVLSSKQILEMEFLIDDLSHGSDGKQFHLTKDRLQDFRNKGVLMSLNEFAEFASIRFGA